MNRDVLVALCAAAAGLAGTAAVAAAGFAAPYVLWLLSALLPVPAYLLAQRRRAAVGMVPGVVMGAAAPPVLYLAWGPPDTEDLVVTWLASLGMAVGINAAAVLLLAAVRRSRRGERA
jgi:hypothetical protein